MIFFIMLFFIISLFKDYKKGSLFAGQIVNYLNEDESLCDRIEDTHEFHV